jgi:hypothetical protein
MEELGSDQRRNSMTALIQTGRAYAEALVLAKYYLTNPLIQQVHLFGGVAATGDSKHDIDLILVVDRDMFEAYIDEINRRIAYSRVAKKLITSDTFTKWRREIIEKLIGALLIPASQEIEFSYPVDALLFPPNWEDGKNEANLANTSWMHRKCFVGKLQKYARLYDESLNDFLPPRQEPT